MTMWGETRRHRGAFPTSMALDFLRTCSLLCGPDRHAHGELPDVLFSPLRHRGEELYYFENDMHTQAYVCGLRFLMWYTDCVYCAGCMYMRIAYGNPTYSVKHIVNSGSVQGNLSRKASKVLISHRVIWGRCEKRCQAA